MDVVLNAGVGGWGGGGGASLPLVCLSLAIRADSQVPAPTDDPRLWPSPSWHPRRHRLAEEGETIVQPPHGSHAKTGPSNE